MSKLSSVLKLIPLLKKEYHSKSFRGQLLANSQIRQVNNSKHYQVGFKDINKPETDAELCPEKGQHMNTQCERLLLKNKRYNVDRKIEHLPLKRKHFISNSIAKLNLKANSCSYISQIKGFHHNVFSQLQLVRAFSKNIDGMKYNSVQNPKLLQQERYPEKHGDILICVKRGIRYSKDHKEKETLKGTCMPKVAKGPILKTSPICQKKEFLCEKKKFSSNMEDPCKKKEDPCKKKEDPCKKKEDPCKKKEDPCKKKEDPCKKKEDPCKKKEDPCKNKEDPCKKKEKADKPSSVTTPLCKRREFVCKKKTVKSKEAPPQGTCSRKILPSIKAACVKKTQPPPKKKTEESKKKDPCKKKEE